jgi:diguanylate cyclase (GGDEF)-like protein
VRAVVKRGWSLTVVFTIVSIIAFIGLGFGLTAAMQAQVADQAMADAKANARIVTGLAVEGRFGPRGPQALGGEFDRDDGVYLNRVVMQSGGAVRSLQLWSPRGELLYDSTGAARPTIDNADFNAALRGDVVADLSTEIYRGEDTQANGVAGQRLDVFVPVNLGTDLTRAVAQVGVRFDETQARVDAANQRIIAIIGVALLLVWLLLLRVVRRASRRLRDQADENEQLALQDPLTDLPNRRLLAERLERAAALSARSGGRVGLLLLDVDRFKEVNDTLGHDRGDRLLQQVADRLKRSVRDMDTVARLGGDEFAILLPTVNSVADAEAMADRVLRTFDQPFALDGLDLHVDTSIGVAVLPDHADDVTTLMRRADVAMYQAKTTHTGSATYDFAGDDHSTNRLVLLSDLRRALDTDQLEVYYQPKVNLTTGEAVGLEALLRWHHPEHGLVPPEEFIPLAERTGLIHQVTRHVLRMVVAQVGAWDRNGQEIPVAVNLSARNLMESSFVEYIADLLDEFKVHPCLLELEVTESAMIDDPVKAHQMLDDLAGLGLQIAVDDFGTGYTSMAQLERMPLRTLKIDRSFVLRMLDDPGGAVLVKAIVELAHEFNLIVVAEGVEQPEMIAQLQELGCDVAQGFHWSEPVPAHEVQDVLERVCGPQSDLLPRVPSAT